MSLSGKMLFLKFEASQQEDLGFQVSLSACCGDCSCGLTEHCAGLWVFLCCAHLVIPHVLLPSCCKHSMAVLLKQELCFKLVAESKPDWSVIKPDLSLQGSI
eukprot:scaffold161959_cov15-Tisochrysis_lutea.AAC.1